MIKTAKNPAPNAKNSRTSTKKGEQKGVINSHINPQENPAFLKEQIITYLGNKRALLGFLKQGFDFARGELKKEKPSFLDMFSGSGVVSRYAKGFAGHIIANDLEDYSRIINSCYLANIDEKALKKLREIHKFLQIDDGELKKGFISELYAPKDDKNITKSDRVFFTARNAAYLDTMRAKISREVPKEWQDFFIAPLIYEASVHSNTSGVFKGFYKDKMGVGKFGGSGENALPRILGEIRLPMPVFSRFACEFEVVQKEASALAQELESVDIAYFDPPYNQHPYGSNYFMLNLIANYAAPQDISRVSGIPKAWNRSAFNKARLAENALFELVREIKAKIVLLSYNCEGFVRRENFERRLRRLGKCFVLEQRYNAFRGSRNLSSRALHINEQLYVVVKR